MTNKKVSMCIYGLLIPVDVPLSYTRHKVMKYGIEIASMEKKVLWYYAKHHFGCDPIYSDLLYIVARRGMAIAKRALQQGACLLEFIVIYMDPCTIVQI
jgi:hypothetical protein